MARSCCNHGSTFESERNRNDHKLAAHSNRSSRSIETDSRHSSSSSDKSLCERYPDDDRLLAAHKNASSLPPSSSSDELLRPSRKLPQSVTEEELHPLMMLATAAVNDYECRFKCSICNKGFASFQALGGHKGHCRRKKMKMNGGRGSSSSAPVTSGQNIHKCSVCSKEFSSGAALGGHMRKHSY